VGAGHLREMRGQKAVQALARVCFGYGELFVFGGGAFKSKVFGGLEVFVGVGIIEHQEFVGTGGGRLGQRPVAARVGAADGIGAAPRKPRHQRKAPVRISATLTSCMSEIESWNIRVRPGSPRKNSMVPRSTP